jgi:biotin operon repressor
MTQPHRLPAPRLRPGSYPATTQHVYRKVYEAWPTGVTTRELAARLGKSQSTVYAHVGKLLANGTIVKAGHGGRLFPRGHGPAC